MVRFKIMYRKKEDRISLLPDCLLLEIISRLELSTKEVIKTTSTISKRWQHLWTQLPTLAFIYKEDITDLCYTSDLTDYFSFIDKTLTQYPTDVNLNKFKLIIRNNSQVYTQPKSQVYSWIRHAITRNVQEVDLLIWDDVRCPEKFSYDDELFFNNSCLMSMKLSYCVFNPPNGAIRWDKLKCLCIDDGTLDGDSIGKVLSGSPCLETLELNNCYVVGRIPKSLFGNFGVEQLSCGIETYESFKYGDELFLDDSYPLSIKLSRGIFSPLNGAIRLEKLKFLCIDSGKLVEDSIGKILSGSPCLETLKLNYCYGVRRIDVTSKSVKNLVFSNHSWLNVGAGYIDTIKINAPYILSLTINGSLCLEKILLLNVSSLVKADLDYMDNKHFDVALGRTRKYTKEEFLSSKTDYLLNQ
ncbi:ribonuclease H-like domain-containing protein [Tanacetum coccineum]